MTSKKVVAVFAALILLCVSVVAVVAINNDNQKTDDSEIVVQYGGREYRCKYDDSYFDGSASKYNPDLAVTSYCLIRGTAFETRGDYANYDRNARAFTEKIGFEDFECNDDFNRKPTDDSIGIYVASKELDDCTLLIAGLRIGDYEREWADDFRVGKTDANDPFGHHLGFKRSADKVISFLNSYIGGHGITGKIKIWATGYSRSAAISNIVGGMLDTSLKENRPILDNVTYTKDDVFVYTFETPNTVQPVDGLNVHGTEYDNIWNVSRTDDIVTKILPWGFTLYGNVRDLPEMNFEDKDFDDEWRDMLALYEEAGGNRDIFLSEAYYMEGGTAVVDPDPLYPNIGGYLTGLTGIIGDKIECRDKYVDDGHQEVMMDFAHIVMENGQDGLKNFIDTIESKVEKEPFTALKVINCLKNGDKEGFTGAIRPWVGDAMSDAKLKGDTNILTEGISDIVFFLKEVIDESDNQYKLTATFCKNAKQILYAHGDFYAPYCWIKTMG